MIWNPNLSVLAHVPERLNVAIGYVLDVQRVSVDVQGRKTLVFHRVSRPERPACQLEICRPAEWTGVGRYPL